jgi:hypothetical protein
MRTKAYCACIAILLVAGTACEQVVAPRAEDRALCVPAEVVARRMNVPVDARDVAITLRRSEHEGSVQVLCEHMDDVVSFYTEITGFGSEEDAARWMRAKEDIVASEVALNGGAACPARLTGADQVACCAMSTGVFVAARVGRRTWAFSVVGASTSDGAAFLREEIQPKITALRRWSPP